MSQTFSVRFWIHLVVVYFSLRLFIEKIFSVSAFWFRQQSLWVQEVFLNGWRFCENHVKRKCCNVLVKQNKTNQNKTVKQQCYKSKACISLNLPIMKTWRPNIARENDELKCWANAEQLTVEIIWHFFFLSPSFLFACSQTKLLQKNAQ